MGREGVKKEGEKESTRVRERENKREREGRREREKRERGSSVRQQRA